MVARILLIFLAALIITTLAAPSAESEENKVDESSESMLEPSGTMEQDYYGGSEEYEYDGK